MTQACSIFAGIALIDEPANIGVTTFAANGEVLLNISMRDGGDLDHIILGLSAHQALQLIERLSTYSDVCGRAAVEGRGGNRFPDAEPKP